MKYFAILDLSDSGDGICTIECETEEEAFGYIKGYDCPAWVAVEVKRDISPDDNSEEEECTCGADVENNILHTYSCKKISGKDK